MSRQYSCNKIYKTPPSSIPFVYSLQDYKVDKNMSGRNVTISILGSGLPTHSNIKTFGDTEIFIDDTKIPEDFTGESTILAGIISAYDTTGIIGFIPTSKILYTKVISEDVPKDYNSIRAGILWSIVKKTNLIVIIPTLDKYNTLLDSVSQKAQKEESFIVALDTPEKNIYKMYPNIFTVSTKLNAEFSIKHTKNNIFVSIPEKEYFTTYLEQQFVSTPLNLLGLGIITSILACSIENQKQNKKNITPTSLLKFISSL